MSRYVYYYLCPLYYISALLLCICPIYYIAPCTHGSVTILDYNGRPIEDNEGIVAVCMNGVWSAICDNMWGFEDASVACSNIPGYSPYGK